MTENMITVALIVGDPSHEDLQLNGSEKRPAQLRVTGYRDVQPAPPAVLPAGA
jgi:hypothetical protein